MQDLKEIFKEAAEIAKLVPANMQEAAFNRALDALMGTHLVATTKKSGGLTKRSRAKRSKGPSESASATGDTARQPRKVSQGLGPKSAIEWLMENNFFETGKTGPAVQEFLQKKRGYNLGTRQLRTAMFRLVRAGVMEREENAEGHYEYKAA